MTKKEKQNKCREILNKYNVGENVYADDFFFLFTVFEGHPEWELKMGNGIDEISIGTAQFNTRCFVLHRCDGTMTDISFLKSITHPSDTSKIKAACRRAILPEITKCRNSVVFGVSRCPITNELLTIGNTHIDHYDLTFAEIYEKWVSCQNITYLAKSINKTIDNNTETYFIDPKISNDFRIFHNMNTHLRAVTKEANISLIKRKPNL